MSEFTLNILNNTTQTKQEAATARLMGFIKRVVGEFDERVGAFRSGGKKGEIAHPKDRLQTVMGKVERGEDILEDDFGSMYLLTFYANEALSVFSFIGKGKEKTHSETTIPLGKERPSWFQRVGALGADLLPGLGGLLGRSRNDNLLGQAEEAVRDDLAFYQNRNRPNSAKNVPEFLKAEVVETLDALDTGIVERDQDTILKLLAAKNFSEKLILSKYAERYGVSGRAFKTAGARANIEAMVGREVTREQPNLTVEQIDRRVQTRLMVRDGEGKTLLDREMEKAKAVHESWRKLSSNDRLTIQFFRDMCQTFNINPDSIVARDGLIREYNPQGPFGEGKVISHVTIVEEGGEAKLVPVDKTTIYDLLDSQIKKTRYLVAEAHIKTLLSRGIHVTYQDANKIRLHGWQPSQQMNEIAAAGLGGAILDANNRVDQQKLGEILGDYLQFGRPESRQRMHNLVQFSTLVFMFEKHYSVPTKVAERGYDAEWDAYGNKEALKSFLETDEQFRLATRKYTTGEYLREGEPSEGSFDFLLQEARRRGDVLEIRDLTLAEIRAKQFLRLLFAPHKGFAADEASARQAFNYIYGPGGEVNSAAIGAFLRGLEEGTGGWRAGNNPVTNAAEVVFEQTGKGYFVVTNDDHDQARSAEFVNVTEGHFYNGIELKLTEIEEIQGRTIYWKAAQVKNPGFVSQPEYMGTYFEPDLPTRLTQQNEIARRTLTDEEIVLIDRPFYGEILRVNLNSDGTVANQEYVLGADLTREQWEVYLKRKANYHTPGWMQPVEGAAGASPWQGMDGGEWMQGIMATTWELRTIQMRWVSQELGERFDESNPEHWAIMVKNLLEMCEKHPGWMHEFKKQYGEVFDPMNGEHLVRVAARLQGITEEEWHDNWRKAHDDHDFEGKKMKNGKANKDLTELLDYLRKPEHWTIEGADNGLYIDLTQKVWRDRLKNESFYVWRYEQARNTFKQILPLIRGLSPQGMVVGGKIIGETGIYGITPAKADAIVAGVYGHLSWWRAHQAARALYQKINEKYDHEIREQIRNRLVSHSALSNHFEHDMLWREAILTSTEGAEVDLERHFFRGRELQTENYLDEALALKGSPLTSAEIDAAEEIHHRLYGEEIIVTRRMAEEGITLRGAAEMVKGKRQQNELRVLNDLVLYSELANTPGISLESILGTVIEKQMFWYVVPLLGKEELARIKEDPSQYTRIIESSPNLRFVERNDPRFRRVRQQLLEGLYSTSSRSHEKKIMLKIWLEKVTAWGIMNGPSGAANQGLHQDKVYHLWRLENVMEMGTQFREHFAEAGYMNWETLDGEHAYLPESVVMFAKEYYGIDLMNEAQVANLGGDNLIKQINKIVQDRQRLMCVCFGIDYQRDKDETGNFEWYIRKKIMEIPEKAPAWWIDIPPLQLYDAQGNTATTIGAITYERVRTTIRRKVDFDPNFSRTVEVEPLNPGEKEVIRETLNWLGNFKQGKNMEGNEFNEAIDVPDFIYEQLFFWAGARLNIGITDETRNSVLPLILNKLSANLDQPNGLKIYLFDIFGIDIGRQASQGTIVDVKNRLKDITDKIIPPGMIMRAQIVSQMRNFHFYADRIAEKRSEAYGMSPQEKDAMEKEMAQKAMPETEELADWTNSRYTQTKSEVAAIVKKMALTDENRWGTPEDVNVLWGNWIGELPTRKVLGKTEFVRDVKDEITIPGYPELEKVLYDFNLSEQLDQANHDLAHGRLPLISFIPSILSGLAQGNGKALVEKISRYADPNIWALPSALLIQAGVSVFSLPVANIITGAFRAGDALGGLLGGGLGAGTGVGTVLGFVFSTISLLGTYYAPSLLMGRGIGWLMLNGLRGKVQHARFLNYEQYQNRTKGK